MDISQDVTALLCDVYKKPGLARINHSCSIQFYFSELDKTFNSVAKEERQGMIIAKKKGKRYKNRSKSVTTFFGGKVKSTNPLHTNKLYTTWSRNKVPEQAIVVDGDV